MKTSLLLIGIFWRVLTSNHHCFRVGTLTIRLLCRWEPRQERVSCVARGTGTGMATMTENSLWKWHSTWENYLPSVFHFCAPWMACWRCQVDLDKNFYSAFTWHAELNRICDVVLHLLVSERSLLWTSGKKGKENLWEISVRMNKKGKKKTCSAQKEKPFIIWFCIELAVHLVRCFVHKNTQAWQKCIPLKERTIHWRDVYWFTPKQQWVSNLVFPKYAVDMFPRHGRCFCYCSRHSVVIVLCLWNCLFSVQKVLQQNL